MYAEKNFQKLRVKRCIPGREEAVVEIINLDILREATLTASNRNLRHFVKLQ